MSRGAACSNDGLPPRVQVKGASRDGLSEETLVISFGGTSRDSLSDSLLSEDTLKLENVDDLL